MSEKHPNVSSFEHDPAPPRIDEDHILDLCSRSIRRLHKIAQLDPMPSVLVRGEADILEQWITELKLLRHAS
jgi:hypothetical protein